MARHGVEYDAVKHAAIKLLSEGTAPSVHKIRDMLGTGSNTTIATHLKQWRDEYTQKKVHYLPADMPKELIAVFEVLWQTAMEHAQNQLCSQKETLDNERIEIQDAQKKAQAQLEAAQQRIDELTMQLAQQSEASQALKTQLAVAEERLAKQAEMQEVTEKQHEQKAQRYHQERDKLLDEKQGLQTELNQLRADVTKQAESYQASLEKQRASQELMENRWLKLIDDAKLEAKAAQKQFEIYRKDSEKSLTSLKEKLANMQEAQFELKAKAKVDLAQITQLQQEKKSLGNEVQRLQSEIMVLNSKLNSSNARKNKKQIVAG